MSCEVALNTFIWILAGILSAQILQPFCSLNLKLGYITYLRYTAHKHL